MRRLLPLLVCLLAGAASARVISYAPTSDRLGTPAVQHRMNRHFAVIEYDGDPSWSDAQLVLYDSKGEEEPRVVFPQSGKLRILAAAVREEEGQLVIFVQTAGAGGAISVDGGTSWKSVALPQCPALMTPWRDIPDSGGPYVRGRYSALRIGTREVPFLFTDDGNYNPAPHVYGITSDGVVRKLVATVASLIGTSRDGARLLVHAGALFAWVDLNGNGQILGVLPNGNDAYEGWITPEGKAFVEAHYPNYDFPSLFFLDGTARLVNPILNATRFAVPTADYNGAWVLTRNPRATALWSISSNGVAAKQWEDATTPEVEALIAGQSGKTVLVQVHRPRAALDTATFKDPALAVWRIGEPAPPSYDELYLEETTAKAFVHVDPDTIERGEPFVFDSGVEKPQGGGGIISPAPPSAGGGDVLQEWGVVRASLAQRLVLPGAARTAGAFGSFWTTDVTFYNPGDRPVTVSVRYAANGGGGVQTASEAEKSLTLNAQEIRIVRDILHTLFGLASGGGALFITPQVGAAVNVSSRTYTTSPSGGTYGYGMNAIDVFAAAGPRFPVTFSGAFLGEHYRTNLALTDVSGRGSEVQLSAWGASGSVGTASANFAAPLLGAQQFNFVGDTLGLAPAQSAALLVQPTRGEVVASVFAIDNRTNDATYFPPDLPASLVRVIPAIGHVDGANGTKFRTDVYIFNNSAFTKYLTVQPRMWDGGWWTSTVVILKGHELRVIPDMLYTMFGKSGMARLRLWSQGLATDSSLRVTSRTYTVDANGGTYGFLLPPLNSFQNGTAGDTLEILGTTLSRRFRTNIGLVDLSQWGAGSPRVRIDVVDHGGAVISSFEATVPAAGGVQLNDVYHAHNLPDASSPVLIRITVLQGMIGAYAAMLDNDTNDPAYFAANLGAKR